eukprot:6181493-Pleurochrysis_carterae.AAC.2
MTQLACRALLPPTDAAQGAFASFYAAQAACKGMANSASDQTWAIVKQAHKMLRRTTIIAVAAGRPPQ